MIVCLKTNINKMLIKNRQGKLERVQIVSCTSLLSVFGINNIKLLKNYINSI